jgi:DamX protein
LALGLAASAYLAWAVLLNVPAQPRVSIGTPIAIEIAPAGALEPVFADQPVQESALSLPVTSAASPARAPEPVLAQQTLSADAAAPVVNAVAVTSSASRPIAEGQSRLSDRDWLLAQDPTRYTVQLGSALSQEKASAFVDKYSLQGRVVAVKVVRGGNSNYIVLYNSYATLADAARGIESLPAGLRKNVPFARRISAVRAMIKEG